jgi:cell division protein FtsB
LQSQIQALEEKKAALQAGISQGQSEGFVEKEAREKLGLKKPGEEVVVVMPPEENQTTSAQQNKSLWQKFLQFLHLRD